jgi:hypothetical protein
MRHIARTTLYTALLSLVPTAALAEEAINYQDHIRPIFQQSCFNCHNPDRARGGLDLTSYRATVAGGSSGDIVVAQASDQSTLLGVMNHTMEPKMPPNGGKVADDKLKLVKLWIDQGLRETANSQANKPKKPRVDLSVGEAAVGRPAGPPIMPASMPLGPIQHTTRPGAVVDVAGHPWSPIVASTGQRQILVHHTETGELLGVIPFAYGQPQTLRFSWTGRLLVVGGGVGGASGTVALYDVTSGEEVARVGEAFDEVIAADIDPTQAIVAMGGPSKRVKGYSVATGEPLYNLDKHTEWVTAVAFSPDGAYLASGDRNGGIHIWEADSGLHVHRLDGHGNSVTALSWRYDGKVLASAGEDGQARLWEMKNGRQVKNWSAHSGGAMAIAYSEDGRLVTTGRDRLVRVWDANGGKKFEVKPLDSIGLSAAFDTTAKAVVAGDLSGKLVRWSLEDQAKRVDTWSSNPLPIEAALSQAEARVAEQLKAFETARTLAEQKGAEADQAKRAAADAERALQALREAIKLGEQTMPQTERARKAANDRLAQASAQLRDARQSERQSANTLKAKQGESRNIRRDRDRAASDLEKARQDLARAEAEAEQAKRKAAEQPDNQGFAKQAEEKRKRVEQARQRVAEREKTLAQREEQLAAALKREDEAKAKREALALKVDAAEQMEQARKLERDDANQTHDLTRKRFFENKGKVRPAETALKQAHEKAEQAEVAASRAAEDAVLAREQRDAAQRRVAKWQSAELRLQIDALRAERDVRRSERETLATQRDAKRAEREDLKRQLDKAQASSAELQAQLEKQQAAIAEAQQEVDRLTKQVDPAKPDTELALEDAAFELETQQYTRRKLTESLAELPDVIAQTQAKLTACDAAIVELERRLASLGDPGASLQKQIDELQPRYEALREAAGF